MACKNRDAGRHMQLRLFVSAVFFFSSFLVQAQSAVSINNEVKVGEGKSVRDNGLPNFGHGYMIGCRASSGMDGPWWSTAEITISQGCFDDKANYTGSIVKMSIDGDLDNYNELFEKFEHLESGKAYIFEYIVKLKWNPEIENEKIQLRAVYTPEEFLKTRNIKSLPYKFESGNKHTGWRTNGANKSGRIVDVERNGMIGSFCTLELNVGGLNTNGKGEAMVWMNITDEDLCTYATSIMALQLDLSVAFTKDKIEYWQPYKTYCNGIECSKGAITIADQSAEAVITLSPEQLTTLKAEITAAVIEELKSDTSFINVLSK